MKKFTSVICATAAVAGMLTLMTACDTKAKLAESVQGKWTGNPEKMLDTGAASASMVRTLEFTKGAADTEGSVTMTAMITVENTMQIGRAHV